MTLDRCPWYVAGPLFGLLIVGLRAALNRPFGALGGYIDLANARTAKAAPSGFRLPLLIGIVVGGALYAITTGTFSPSLTYVGAGLPALGRIGSLTLLVVAGTVMGFGARTAGGCTSGHGMSGMSLGSPASIVAGMTFFGTAVLLARALLHFGAAS
jgi:uncharacterized membrane protein YedE/YeeE